MVFDDLLRTSLGRRRPYLPYEVSLTDNRAINAFTAPDGKVYVYRGMVSLLGNNAGLWAALLGHEIGHTLGRHYYKSQLRYVERQRELADYRARAAAGDEGVVWEELTFRLLTGAINLKLSREEEHEADRLGLGMMAEAGYHPDFTIAFFRRVRAELPDKSKLGAFFSTHPRSATREERTIKVYNSALTIFEHFWPDTSQSPGGTPPPIVTLGRISTSRDRVNKAAVVHVPFQIRNAKDIPITIIVIFKKNKKLVPGAMKEYQLNDGSLVAIHTVTPDSWSQSMDATISIPTSALGTKSRTFKAMISLITRDEHLAYSDIFKVSFPKR